LKEGNLPGNNWGTEDKTWWGKLNTTIDGKSVQMPMETISGNYPGFYQNVAETIRGGKPLTVKPEESRNVIQLIEMCYESNRLRKAIKIN
jgi:scyllo-inositol 2-dehydrogenase (NADP+)